MAASGKRPKTKWKAVPLNNVLDPTTVSAPTKSSSWADECDNDLNDDYGRKVDKFVLPTAPRAARALEDDSKIPQDPPYLAYVTNIPYDMKDEDELISYFESLNLGVKIKTVTLPREDRTNKVRGYGYIEFVDRASFVNVMANVADTNIRGRRIRIDVANQNDSRASRGIRSGGSNEPDYISQDWRSGPSRGGDEDGYRSGGRSQYGGDRDRDRGGGGFGRRDDRRGGFDRDRDRDRYRDRGGSGFRDDRDWTSRDGDRRRDDRDRDRYGGRSSYDDRRRDDYSSWRRNDDDRDKDREYPPPERSEPKTRPRITLQPRTKPLEEDNKEQQDSSAAAIFGGAKPVDTAAREREIEERLARQSTNVEEPRRKGGASQESWDKEKERDRGRDRERDRESQSDPAEEDKYHRTSDRGSEDERAGSRDRDSNQGRDYEDRESDKERGVSPRDVDKEREKGRGEEPAKRNNPPKENPWTRRSQQQSGAANGRASPTEEVDGNVKGSRGPSPRLPAKDEQSEPVRKYQPPRGKASENRGGDRKQHEERFSSRGGHQSDGRGRGGGSSSNAQPSKATAQRTKEAKKEERDDTIRMPKFQEQEAPNFAGSNKYAFLEEPSGTAAN